MATLKQVAIHLGISAPRVKQLVDQEILPRAERGAYDIESCRISYLSRLRHEASYSRHSATADLKRQRAEVELELRKYELAERLGLMVRASDLEPFIQRKLVALRGRLLPIGGKIAPIINPEAPAEVQDVIDKAIHDALEELIGNDEDTEDSRGSVGLAGEDLEESKGPLFETPTKTKRKRMGRSISKIESRGKRRARQVGDVTSRISKGNVGRGERSKSSHRGFEDGVSGRENGAVLKRRRLFHPSGSGSNSDG
jgi:hypothetical protein